MGKRNGTLKAGPFARLRASSSLRARSARSAQDDRRWGASEKETWLVGIRALKRRLGHYASPKGLITGVRLQILLERCLRAAESEFEQTIEATRASRREHPSLRSGQVIGASADLGAVAAADALAGACARRADAVSVWG
jgi:hypothetical protein